MWLLIIGIVVFLLALRAAISSSLPPPETKKKVCKPHAWIYKDNNLWCSICKKTPGQILDEM
jgi:hypothetical protein